MKKSGSTKLKVCVVCHARIHGGCIILKNRVLCGTCFNKENKKRRELRDNRFDIPLEKMRYPDYGLGNMKVEEIATIEKSDEDKKPGWEFRQQFTYGNAREIYIFQEMQRLCRMINVKM